MSSMKPTQISSMEPAQIISINLLLNKEDTLDVTQLIWFLEYEEWQIEENSRDKSKNVIIPCDGQYAHHGNASRAREEKKADEIRPKIKADILVSELLPDIIWLLKYDQDLITTNELHIKEQERDKSKDKPKDKPKDKSTQQRDINNYERIQAYKERKIAREYKEAREKLDKANEIRIRINEYISKKDVI